ncbi:cation-transporting P-type ATPase [Candidatus Peregrinibacteria bacterium]|nr:cation-transporting P-type ATPase [Candidatus Peregrinibacteria bacterium]
MNQEIIFNILATLGSIAPMSLIASLNIPKFYLKLHGRLAKTTSICTPITGVLTKEPVEVKTFFFDKFKARAELNVAESHHFKLLDIQSKLEIDVKRSEFQKEFAMNLMAITTCLCHYEKMKNIEHITENLFKSCAIDLKKIHEENQIITKLPSTKEKKISTVVAMNGKTKEIFAFSKGNPYKILEKCTRELISRKRESIDHQRRHKLKKRIEKMTKRGQKIIAFAYKPMPIKRLENYSEQLCEHEMVLVGLIGLVENINTELIPYIEEIKKNKIKIYVISGVKEKKAVAIATEMQIVNPNHFEAIDGLNLDSLDDEKLGKILANKEKDYIFCNIKPHHRTKIVETLEKNGEVVTFASKRHGHGIKELLEHIDRSRKNKQNRGKLISHALNSKITELILLLAALILQAPFPFSIYLIITLDILINTILELALNTERNTDAQIINEDKIFNAKFISTCLFSTLAIGTIYFWNLLRFGWIPGENIILNSEAYLNSGTMIFILLAIIQIIIAFEIRFKEKSLFKIKTFSNPYMMISAIICALILKIITTYPAIEKILGLTNLKTGELMIVYFTALLFLLLMESHKVLMKYLKNNLTNETTIPSHQSHPKKSEE